jgi:hypothetical protein
LPGTRLLGRDGGKIMYAEGAVVNVDLLVVNTDGEKRPEPDAH